MKLALLPDVGGLLDDGCGKGGGIGIAFSTADTNVVANGGLGGGDGGLTGAFALTTLCCAAATSVEAASLCGGASWGAFATVGF